MLNRVDQIPSQCKLLVKGDLNSNNNFGLSEQKQRVKPAPIGQCIGRRGLDMFFWENKERQEKKSSQFQSMHDSKRSETSLFPNM